MSITKPAIIEAAIHILNEHGLERLRMRELAKRLDIKAASLYWHVKNKDELLALIAEHISEKLTLDNLNGPPDESITQVLSHYRACLLEVRDAVLIFNQTPPATPARARLIATMLRKLEELGVQAENLIATANLLNNYVLAFVADELVWKQALPPGTTELFGYPFDMDFDRQFRYGVNVLLSGITSTTKMGRRRQRKKESI